MKLPGFSNCSLQWYVLITFEFVLDNKYSRSANISFGGGEELQSDIYINIQLKNTF